MKNYLKQAIRLLIKRKINNPEKLARLKRQLCLRYKIEPISNITLFRVYHKLIKDSKIPRQPLLEKLLKTRPMRTLSGVAVVTVLAKPYPCPGRCLYCPSEKGMPKSYLSNEPAAMRAALNQFDPYRQVATRLKALAIEGHPTDKIELIVLGGTWTAYPQKYRKWFIGRCFAACNGAPPQQKISLAKAQKANEKSRHRIVGLTLETRPDHINQKIIKEMRQLGCTRLELGVQNTDDEILRQNRRGHTIADVIRATKLLKDTGFKINYHLMPNLPGSTPGKDKQMFETLFTDPNFQPDLLKIYPCVVLKNAPLYALWKKGGYCPYSLKTLTNLLLQVKSQIPPYVRIQRIIRDIPSQSVVAGNKISNLRQLLDQRPDKICACIRCREIRNQSAKTKLKLIRRDYPASGGQEIFLSFEDIAAKKLHALLRLRLPSFYFEKKSHWLAVLNQSALIREIHTYGQLIELKKKKAGAIQHAGLGKKLLRAAEKIAKKEFGLKKIAVIAGVGVRSYYRRLGYQLKDSYMVKRF